jgi:hypothetical protein
MNRTISRGLVARACLAAVVALLLAFVIGSASSGGDGGLNLRDVRAGDTVTSGTVDQDLSVANGDIRLVASGTSVKTHLHSNGTPVSNIKIWWDDPIPGGLWLLQQFSIWNPGAYSSIYVGWQKNGAGCQQATGHAWINSGDTYLNNPPASEDCNGEFSMKTSIDNKTGGSLSFTPLNCAGVNPAGGWTWWGTDC